MYKYIKYLSVVLVIIILCTGCVKQEKQEEQPIKTYDEHMIMGLTEQQYLNAIKNDIEMIYAPRTNISETTLRNMLEKYMTEECAIEFSTANKESTVEPKDVTLTWRRINFAYGEHQTDGISRVLAQFRVDTTNRMWEITLELKLNSESKIYDYDVY